MECGPAPSLAGGTVEDEEVVGTVGVRSEHRCVDLPSNTGPECEGELSEVGPVVA